MSCGPASGCRAWWARSPIARSNDRSSTPSTSWDSTARCSGSTTPRYASLAVRTGWPSLYDITDDWLLAPLAPRQRDRLMADERLLMEHSQEVVVCSPELARSRGANRPVELIPNGVDVDLFRTARPRPADLPPSPVALYVGTLHTWRIDIPLVLELAGAPPGPPGRAGRARTACRGTSTDRLERVPNIHVLGARPYDQIPAYMQHADVVIIPHLVDPFTESLDPIKAYECLAAGRPTVATPVAGFRELGPPIVTADRSRFVEATSTALAAAGPAGLPGRLEGAPIPTWHDRAEAMASLMVRAREEGRIPVRPARRPPLRPPGPGPGLAGPGRRSAGRGYSPGRPGRPILGARPTGSPKARLPLTFPEFLSTLWRKRLIIVVSVVVAVAAALAYSKLHTPMYQSTALVQINSTTSATGQSSTQVTLPDPVQALSSTAVELQAAKLLDNPDVAAVANAGHRDGRPHHRRAHHHRLGLHPGKGPGGGQGLFAGLRQPDPDPGQHPERTRSPPSWPG